MRTLESQDVYWIKRRLPKSVLAMMFDYGSACVLAGGFIRSCIANEPTSDIDLFSTNKDHARMLANKAALWQGCRMVETDNAFTVLGLTYPVQFIHRWTFDEPQKIVPSFDFTIARAAVWFGQRTDAGRHRLLDSLCDDRFYSDLAAKRLVYCSPERNEDAGGSMLRVLKFYQKGYRIPLDSMAAVMARMAVAVNDEKLAGLSGTHEQKLAYVFTGLLREVDPEIDPLHLAHMPAIGAV